MAIYESEQEVREFIIDAFDKSTGRGDFLRTILGVGAAVVAAGVGAGLLGAKSVDAASLDLPQGVTRGGVANSDLTILNYALTLEHLEATFYAGVQPADAPTAQVAAYVKQIAADEKAHVDALTAVILSLGGQPVKQATYNFPKISLPFGITVENLGVGAYLGAAPYIQNTTILLTAASIVTVEARHASAWATIYDSPDPAYSFAPNTFDKGVPMSTVLPIAKQFIVG